MQKLRQSKSVESDTSSPNVALGGENCFTLEIVCHPCAPMFQDLCDRISYTIVVRAQVTLAGLDTGGNQV